MFDKLRLTSWSCAMINLYFTDFCGLGQNLAYAMAYLSLLCGLPVAYLLFCKDIFITLAFEGIGTSYLVHIGLLAMAICVIAIETLLPWQQRHVFVISLFEGI